MDSIGLWIGKIFWKLYLFIYIKFLRQYHKDLEKLRESLSILIRTKYRLEANNIDANENLFIYSISNYFLEIRPLPKTLSKYDIERMEKIQADLLEEENYKYIQKLRYQIGYLFAKLQMNTFAFFNNKERIHLEKLTSIINYKKLKSLGEDLVNLEIKDYSRISKIIKDINSQYKTKFLCITLNRENKYIYHLFKYSNKWLIVFLLFSIIASGFFEWGYFSYFKIPIANVPYAINDVIGIILSWSSIMILAAFLSIAYFLLFYRVFKGKKPEELMQLHGSIIKWFFFPPVMYFYFIITMFCFSFWYLTSANIALSDYEILVAFSVSWLIFTQWVFYYYTIRIKVPIFINFLITYIPIFCLYFFLLGNCSAKLASIQQNKNIYIQADKENSIVHGKVIKVISKGYYVLDEYNKIIFYLFDYIKKIN
ncbi:hypothetical protein ACQUW5_06245 [Legionella sp. CNM-1927-20]|uniref:hypothetical protein n=1 Tax=Legionella sp. CNM-1927-20 TaxID=3422221 RepID=UPI00403B2491